MSAKPADATAVCPCGTDKSYGDCCGPLHAGAAAATALSLMRSRYSAYVLKLQDYLLASWHPDMRPLALDLADGVEGVTRWLGLSVKAHREEGDTATVEFIARYRVGGDSARRLHEVSRFVRENGRWFYLDGVQR